MAFSALFMGSSRRNAMKKMAIGMLIIATGTVLELLVRSYEARA